MSTLNRYRLAEAVGGVDDALIAESMEFFYPNVKEGGAVFPPAFAKPRRVWRGWVAAGLAAAMLCGLLTVLPLLGGPDLWGGFYGVIAPLLKPDETEEPYESEYECEPDSEEEIQEPEDDDTEDPDDPKETSKPRETGRGDYNNSAPVTYPAGTLWPSNPNRDPTPEWPTIDIREPRPETPTVPYPSVPTPGPRPWP